MRAAFFIQFLMVFCVAVTTARAEIDLTARLQHPEFLICEPALIFVTVRNQGAQPIRFQGEQAAMLGFDIFRPDGTLLNPLPGAQILTPSVIPPGSTVTITNDLQALFPIARHDSLSVRARLAVGKRSYVTDKMWLDVVPGIEILKMQARAPNGELRVYSLRTINRDKKDRLFLRADNESGTLCYGVADLGRFVRVGKPRMEVDRTGNIHVLHLTAPNQFAHTIISPDAVRMSRSVVEGDLNAVTLEPDGDGSYRVAGAGRVTRRPEIMVEPLPLRRGL
ncbi:MAG: hypothetical protein NZ740_06310 [Kiritimatiellae bacterium]|nr:hypothetical protein [Kiritimatiellia bacterium]MDW8458708.1 hypothetical protein [Verrucomicrobiota bacterium]